MGIIREERFGPGGQVRLLLGDCRAILPELPPIDAIVTDPPYGLGTRMQGGTWGAQEKYRQLRDWDQAPTSTDLDCLISLRIPTTIWGGNYFPLPPTRCWFIWDKLNAVRTMADFEMAWTNLDMPSKRIRLPVGRHDTGHPTQKPIRLVSWCIDRMRLPPRATILDPYMGSGSTVVAALKAGHPSIGIEIEPLYYETACRRVAEEARQMTLALSAPAAAHAQ